MSDLNVPVVRRFLRALVLAPAALPLVAAPALAAPPNSWPKPQPTGPMDFLLVLVIVPVGLALLISLLTVAPSMARGDRHKSGGRVENEWFGGPTQGVEATQETRATEAQGERGGASARW